MINTGTSKGQFTVLLFLQTVWWLVLISELLLVPERKVTHMIALLKYPFSGPGIWDKLFKLFTRFTITFSACHSATVEDFLTSLLHTLLS